MRSYPSCWNKTLAQLGLKRKLRKKNRQKNTWKRKSLIEALEPRQMLSINATTDPESDSDTVIVGSITDTDSDIHSEAKLQAEFTIVGGESKNLFTITTTCDDAGKPKAVIGLKQTETIGIRELHDLELELQLGGLPVSRHLVSVMLPGDEIVQDIRQHRSEIAHNSIGRELDFDALSGSIFDLKKAVDVSKQLADGKLPLSSKAEKLQLYSDLLLANNFINRADDGSEPGQRLAERKEWQHASAIVAAQIQQDLNSNDTQIVNAAQEIRNRIVAGGSFSSLSFQGFGVNYNFSDDFDQVTKTKRYSAVYESGQMSIGDFIVVDFNEAAVVTVTETPAVGGADLGQVASAQGAGPASTTEVYSTYDHSITYNPDTQVGSATLSTADYLEVSDLGTNPNHVQTDGLFQFDLSQFTQYTTSAIVTLHPGTGSSTIASQEAHVLPDGYDPDGGLHDEGIDRWSEDWDESTPWNDILDRSHGVPVSTTGGSSTWIVNNNGGGFDPIYLDVTEEVQRKLRAGDLNFDFNRGDGDYTDPTTRAAIYSAVAGDAVNPGDVEEFATMIRESADVNGSIDPTYPVDSVSDIPAFASKYGITAANFNELLHRADINRDNQIDADDFVEFLAIHGVIYTDIADSGTGLDGRTDGADILKMFANWGVDKYEYFKGNYNFDDDIDGLDYQILGTYFENPSVSPSTISP